MNELETLVKEIIQRLDYGKTPGAGAAGETERPAHGFLFPDVDSAVNSAAAAQRVFQEMGLNARRRIIEAVRKAAVQNAELLAKMAQEETRMGRYENKIQKNLLAAEKTPGVEDIQPVIAYTGDRGMTLVEYAPFGVVAAVTPSTNPTSTIINNAISILSAGDAVIFGPHPAAKKSSQEAVKIIHDAATGAGAPSGIIVTVDPPSVEATQALLKHPKVKMNLVTGGPAIVKIAMAAGKKTIAAGPGNPPVVVDETAVFPKCAFDIVNGASFDNGILCTAEKEVVVTEKAAEQLINSMRQVPEAYELTCAQMDHLAKVVIRESGAGCKEPVLNKDFVGRNANVIARSIGLNLPDSTRLLWGVVPNDHPFVWTEQLMPVLPVTVVKDVDTAIEFAVKVEGDNHHTFIMHSLNVANLTKMARECQGSIFVKNGPSYMGLGMGEGYAALSIATPTGDGLVRTRNFTRPLRCVLVDYFRIA
jgi:propionaldehyde dehydrogenase